VVCPLEEECGWVAVETFVFGYEEGLGGRCGGVDRARESGAAKAGVVVWGDAVMVRVVVEKVCVPRWRKVCWTGMVAVLLVEVRIQCILVLREVLSKLRG
jgi:hypothetical protein